MTTITIQDIKKEARKSLARERRQDKTDPYELARHIIDANSLEDLFAHAKESYRITLHIPGPLWTKYKESHDGTRQVVKNALRDYYHCFYVDDSIDDEHFELHYDLDTRDLGSDSS